MKNKKPIIITIVALGIVTAVIYWWMTFANNNSRTPLPESANDDVNVVDYGPPADSDKIQPSDKDKIINDESETEPVGSLQITQSTQQESTVYIRTIITGINSGNCTLTLTKGMLTITKSAPIGVQASYAVCQGFNIPATEFPEGGIWSVKVVAQHSSGTTLDASKTVEVNR